MRGGSRGLGRDHRLAGAGQDAVERVIVAGRDRVELVVVAAGAGDRQAHQPPADHVDPVVDHVVEVAHEPAAQRQEAQGRQRGLGGRVGEIVPGQPVGRELLDDEPIVGRVAVERGDDVVAVGIGPVEVGVLEEDVALGIGVPGDVEPVPPPALAIPRRGQQAVDQAGIGVGGRIGLEGGDLLGGRRQPEQVERDAADQGPPVGGRRRRQRGGLEPGQDEAVERVPSASRHRGPAGASHRGRAGTPSAAARPRRSRRRRARRLRRRRRPGWRFGPGHAHLDPGGEVGDRPIRQLPRGRHLDRRVVPDRLDDRALLGMARHHDRPVVVPLEQGRARIEPQARLLLLRPVAPGAMLDQDRADPRLEELVVRAGWAAVRGPAPAIAGGPGLAARSSPTAGIDPDRPHAAASSTTIRIDVLPRFPSIRHPDPSPRRQGPRID